MIDYERDDDLALFTTETDARRYRDTHQYRDHTETRVSGEVPVLTVEPRIVRGTPVETRPAWIGTFNESHRRYEYQEHPACEIPVDGTLAYMRTYPSRTGKTTLRSFTVYGADRLDVERRLVELTGAPL